MTDQQKQQCAIIREIARLECEREAEQVRNDLAHTPIEKLPPEELTNEQCVLLFAIELTRMKQEGRIGAPRESVELTEHIYHDKDVEKARVLIHKKEKALGIISELDAMEESADQYKSMLAEFQGQLNQLKPAQSVSPMGLEMWRHLLTVNTKTADTVYQRARDFLRDYLSHQTPPKECQTVPDEGAFRAAISQYEPSQWQGSDENIRKKMNKVKAGKQRGWVFGSGKTKIGFASGRREPLIAKINADGKWVQLMATSRTKKTTDYFHAYPPENFTMRPSLKRDSDA